MVSVAVPEPVAAESPASEPAAVEPLARNRPLRPRRRCSTGAGSAALTAFVELPQPELARAVRDDAPDDEEDIDASI